ncbi:Protein SABRE, partial [Dimargaris verticillata]
RSPSEDSLTSRVSADVDAQQKQVISRQWMIEDCELELEHIDIRIVQADFHLFTQALTMNAGLPLAYHGAMRLLPAHLERLQATDQRFVALETLQDIDEPQLSEAVFSNVQVEPLIYSPRIVYFKQAHQADDDPNYHSIPLYQNVDDRHYSFQSNAANLQDSRAIQISLLQSRLQRVRQELAVQRELQQEMEDYLLNADPAQEVMAMQTLERARMNYIDLEHKQRTIERSVRKLKATQPVSPIGREAGQLVCDEHHCERRSHLADPATQADPFSPNHVTRHPDDDDDDNEGSEDSYAATFKHRFLVHSAYGIWNTHVRNVLLKLMYVEESARALRYFMSMSANKVVRELLLATEDDAKGSPGSQSVSDYFSSAERLHADPSNEGMAETEVLSTGSSALPSDPKRWSASAKPPTATAVGPAASDQPVSATSPSRFLQLIKPRKPRRHDIVLNQATTEEYIQYLLASERNVDHETTHPLGSMAPVDEGVDPDDSPSKPAHFRRARHVLTKLRDYYSHHDRLARTMSGQAKDASPDALLGPEDDWGLLHDLADYFIVNSTYVEFLNPQVNASLYHDSDDAVILAAERIQLKTLSLFDDITAEKDVTNPQDDNENLVKTRSLFGFENFQLFAVQKKNFATKPLYFADCNYGATSRQLWPMWVPMEVLLDEPDQTLSILEPLVQKTSGILIYDKANTVRIQANSADINLDDRANFLGLHFPELVIRADSRQYSVIFSIIDDLLVYSEPAKKKHTDQVHTLMLAANISDLSGTLANVEFMQSSIRQRKELVRQQTQSHPSLGALTNARGYRANQLDYLTFQEKLRLTMEMITNTQKQFLSRQQRQESQGRKIIARRTSLRIDRILLSMLASPEQPLCDCTIDNLSLLARSYSDQSLSYDLDIDQALITNQLPDPFYYELLAPFTDEVHGPIDFSRQKMIRLRWSELAPVGGISVVDHFEIDLFPLRVQMTHDIGKRLMRYFFPEKGSSKTPASKKSATDPEQTTRTGDWDSTHRSHHGRTTGSTSSRPQSVHSGNSGQSRRTQSSLQKSIRSGGDGPVTDDRSVMEMKSRASKNKTFVYIKLPGARHCISYQGQKGKNLEDLRGFVFTLPTFEYHNETWSWLEFVTQVKKDTIRVAVSHTGSLVREKFRQIRPHRHQPSNYAPSINEFSSGASSSLNTSERPKPGASPRLTQRSRRQSLAPATTANLVSSEQRDTPQATAAMSDRVFDSARRRSQSVHTVAHSLPPAENSPPGRTSQESQRSRVLNKNPEHPTARLKHKLTHPLSAMSNFARKISRSSATLTRPTADHQSIASSEDRDPEVGIHTEPANLLPPELPAEPVVVAAPSSQPRSRRMSLASQSSRRSRPSSRRDDGTSAPTSRKVDTEDKEKAKLLFGQHYPGLRR